MALYAAAERDAVTGNGALTEITTTSRFDGTYGIRAAVRPGTNATDYITAGTALGAFTTFWDRFWVYFNNGMTSGRTLRQYHNNSGTAVFRLQGSASQTVQGQYWNGSSWVNIGTALTVTSTTLFQFDIKIICGASGSFEWYVGGSLYTSGSASMSSVTDIDEWRGYSSSAVNEATFAENIWGDEPTIGHRYCLAAPTGNGAQTAGSGSYVDVDEAVTSDADLSTLTNNGDAETYTHSAMTLPGGTVKAVQVCGRVKNNAGAAQNVKARLRKSSTDYDQASNYAGIGVAYTAYRARWATDPAGGAWTQASASDTAQEFGMVAQT